MTLVTVSPPLPLQVHVRRPRPLPFPLREPGCTLWRRARRGLFEGVRALGLGPGDRVLVPAWHHGSEVEALVRLGLEPVYYSIGPGLEPNEAELDSLLDDRVRALHLVHYLGIPQDAGRWRAWCDLHGLRLIEDAAQGWLARTAAGPIGTDGDVSIFSLYKAFGLPDGGAALVRGAAPPVPVAARERPRDLGARGLVRTHASWLLTHWSLLPPFARLQGRRRRYDAEADFRLDAAHGASVATRWLLPRIVDMSAPARRRSNYRQLRDALGPWIPAAFRSIPDGASPFALPIAVTDRARVSDALRARGVRAVAMWSVAHPSLRVDQFPPAAAWRATLLALPVHQELRAADLEGIITAVRSVAAAPGG